MRFQGIVALDGVSFDVDQGTVCSLIGPNGAGKTTLFNCISRVYRRETGTILFDGQDISDASPDRVAAAGVARTFQNVALFVTMTVRDNIMVGGYSAFRSGFIATAIGYPGVARRERALAGEAHDLIRFVGLEGCEDMLPSELTFGFQKRVELARALISKPKLLLLDEPAAGLNHGDVADLQQLIRNICDERGVTVLIVEHNMNLVMRVSDKIVALDFGCKIAEGPPAQVQRDPAVIQAYLGSAA